MLRDGLKRTQSLVPWSNKHMLEEVRRRNLCKQPTDKPNSLQANPIQVGENLDQQF
jgi:hypothetical protein